MGFDTYLKKPVKEEDIKAVVENLLRRSRYAESLTALLELRSKLALLEAEVPGDELAADDAYTRYQKRLETLEHDIENPSKAAEQHSNNYGANDTQ